MCGIFGYISNSNQAVRNGLKPLIESIGKANVVRGDDANGYAYPDLVKGTVVYKSRGPFTETVNRVNWVGLQMPEIFIGHTRAATQGDPRKNENNHPLTVGDYTVVHNGVLWNDYSLTKKYNLLRYAEVDSEVIPSIIDRTWIRSPMAKNTHVLKEALREITGSHACAMLDEKEPETLYLWRHSSPLYLTYVPVLKTIVFSSMDAPLKKAFGGYNAYFGSLEDNQGVAISIGKNDLFMEDFAFDPLTFSQYRSLPENADLAMLDDLSIYGL